MLEYFVITPVMVAVLIYVFFSRQWAKVVAVLAQVGLVVMAGQVFWHVAQTGETLRRSVGGYTAMMGIGMVADRLSAMFVLLTTLIFLLATLYSYRNNHSKLYWLLFFLWQASLLGIFLSGDMFNIFVLTEIATIVVTVLIMYKREDRSMYDGMIYLVINTVIVQFFLFGVGYLYRMTGTLDIGQMGLRMAYVDRANQILPYALVMTFVGLKCAMMPMYAWLPKAHGSKGAPSVVSAVLSGLHIKSGLYMYIRMSELFTAIDGQELFLVIGVVTAVVGVILAIAQTDIKLMLAYSTVAQVGLIMVGLNIDVFGSYNYVGALYHIVNHAVFKAALFMSAGIIVHSYHTRDIDQIRGVFRQMPVMATAKILAILGIIGTPLFNGSVSKYFLMVELNWLLEGILIVVNMGTIIIFMKYSVIFFGYAKGPVEKEPLDFMRHGTVIFLSVLCFALGIFGATIMDLLFGYYVQMNLLGYIQKSLIFAVSLVGGYLIYKSMFTQDNAFAYFLAWEKKAEMGFRGICFSIAAFFAFVLIVIGFY